MGTASGFLYEFGICQDGLDVSFEELPSGNIRLVMQGYGITELSPGCYKSLAELLLRVYRRANDKEED